MTKIRKLIKAMLFPHPAFFILFIPLTVATLIYTFVFDKSRAFVAIISYGISAYTLTTVCFQIPDIVKFCKTVHDNNILVNRLFHDPFLQVKISLYGSLIINSGYAIFQMGLGFRYSSLWFCTIAFYYISLAVMRFLLLKDVRSSDFTPGEDRKSELLRFRFCGAALFTITAVFAAIVFFIAILDEEVHYINWNDGLNKLVTVAMAIFTVCALIVTIYNVIRYRKYKSPICSAAKAISLAVTAISVLTLESAIISAFGLKALAISKKALIGITGVIVGIFVFIVAVYMVVRANIELKKLEKESYSEENAEETPEKESAAS